MSNSITWIGMDVHKEHIVVAAVSGAGATAARWETPNTLKGKERLARRLAEFGAVRCACQRERNNHPPWELNFHPPSLSRRVRHGT